MKFCIFGAGAIGGMAAVRLAQAGHEVSVVARGAHLAAIREHGVTVVKGDARATARVRASDQPGDLGPQDSVIVTLKAHSLAAAAPDIAPLLGPATTVVTAMNGIPWWFFQHWGGKLEGTRLAACDPDGGIARALPHERVIGGVVFQAAFVAAPGVIHHTSGNRIILGEPSGAASPRTQALVDALTGAGVEASLSRNIHQDIWYKLMGNVCYNPVSVLTMAHSDTMLADPYMHRMFAAMMREFMALGEALGFTFASSIDERIATTRRLGHIKTSMLQDVEAGRPIELDAIVGAVVEIAEKLALPIPTIEAVFGLVRQRGATLGLYAPR